MWTQLPFSAALCLPGAAGRGQILLFYFIASKEELFSLSLSLQYLLSGGRHLGTHQVGTPVFTYLWFDMNVSLVWGKSHAFSSKTPLDLGGLSVFSWFCIRHVPVSLLDCACRKSLSSSTRGGDCLSYPTLISNSSAQQKKTALTYLLPTRPDSHEGFFFLTCLWPSNLLCCSSSRGLAYKAMNSYNNYIC